MNFRIFSTHSILPLITTLILGGCGGGGGGSSSDPTSTSTSVSSTIGTAYYVDAPIEGVTYICGSQQGKTDPDGTFKFESGHGCELYIGSLLIRTLDASDLSNGVLIFESNPNTAALLQSLDEDADPDNGIAISPHVAEILAQTGTANIPQNDNEIKALISQLRNRDASLNIAAVSHAQAVAHMKSSYAVYAESTQPLVLTDEPAFRQLASGPVLYNIPVMAQELSPQNYKLAQLTDDEFNALPLSKRYIVAQKLYGTLFYAPKMNDFNDSVLSGSFISDTFNLFTQENTPDEISEVENKIETYAVGNYNGQIMAPMLARLYFLSPGKAYINRWAAYILTQTILFTPAFELDTVYTVDAVDVYGDLVRDLDTGFSLQWSTFTHMISDENWRRFRSPEDNGREMLEIYLKDFNDAHVPLAAQALKNWKLDLDSNTLVVSLNENIEPVSDLFEGRTVTNGTDFYSAIVLNPDFLPVVTERLIDIYFPNFSSTRKASLVSQLISSNPMTWTSILKQIIFSKAYLLESDKPRSFEESFYSIAKTLSWKPAENSFYYLVRRMDDMHQSTMRYKLGRKEEVPMDTQSFAWFHKTMREMILIDYNREDPNRPDDAGWPLKSLFASLPSDLFDTSEIDANGRRTDVWYTMERSRASYMIQKLFLAVAGRAASPDEVNALTDLIDNSKYNNVTFNNYRWYDLYGNSNDEDNLKERGYFTQLILDYISRLGEVYQFQAVQ